MHEGSRSRVAMGRWEGVEGGEGEEEEEVEGDATGRGTAGERRRARESTLVMEGGIWRVRGRGEGEHFEEQAYVGGG